MNKRIFGFTLAEVMVTIMVVGVVAGITIPVLFGARADKDTQVYRKALYTLQRGAYNFMNGPGYLELQKQAGSSYNEMKYLNNFTNTQICYAIADEINTKGSFQKVYNSDGTITITPQGVDCGNTGEENPNFVTTDGIAFYNMGGTGKFTHKVILVKRYGESKSETNARIKKETGHASNYIHENGFLRIHMNYRGKFSVPTEKDLYCPTETGAIEKCTDVSDSGYDWGYEQSLIEDYTKLNK